MGSGLEGIVVADTTLSRVDGAAGKLVIAGHHLEELAPQGFEQAAQVLLGLAGLGEARVRVWQKLQSVLPLLPGRTPLEGLRMGLAALPGPIGEAEVVAAFPVILAGVRHGAALPRPDANLGQVEDFLRLYGQSSPDRVRGLSTYLATVSEHGMNASTFTARVVASTGAELLDAVLAALGALSGPLHGGAPGPVLDLLDELEGESDLEAALQARLDAGQRLMGFGHRVYRTRDPRASVLKKAVAQMADSPRLRWAEKVEKAALTVLARHKPERRLETNVEFYTAVLLEAVGFECTMFTPLFATGRVLGWTAHYHEQRRGGRLIRPDSRYVGPEPE
ncbi:MAG: citrate synthase [Candidatus Eremiobacteraeota bacterium]|nr:citrate synthase [Candidatus Eremiobacteraeota bacterium]